MVTKGILDPKLKALFDQMGGAWGCKDKQSVFIYANAEYGRIIGLPHNEDCIGRTDFDMPCETVNCADLFREQDRIVITTGKSLMTLDIHPFAGHNWKVYIFEKSPLLDDAKNIAGTIFHGMDVTQAYNLEIGTLLTRISDQGIKNNILDQNSYLMSNEFDNIKLTQREAEILFFLLRGKTTKKIALYLEISARTVDEYVDKLRDKFHALTRHELIDSAIQHGFLKTIPASLFTRQLSIILNNP